MIKYRPATTADFELTLQLKAHSIKPYISEIWGWDDAVQLEYHKHDFVAEHMQIILDRHDQEIGLIDKVETRKLIFIKSILIDHSVQRNGIGTKVMNDIIQHALLADKPIELQVFKINIIAKKFYEKLGFIIKGSTALHYQMIYKNGEIV